MNVQILIQMFGRLARNLHKLLPLSILFSTHLPIQPLKLQAQIDNSSPKAGISSINQSSQKDTRIKFVKDIVNYAQNESTANRSVIFYEVKGDKFIDNQVLALVRQFNSKHANKVSQDYEFIFLQNNFQQIDNEQSYLVLYGANGQKVISIDAYLNKNRQKPYIKINTQPLMKRLVEGLNNFRELNLENIREELDTINQSDSYSALFTVASTQSDVNWAKAKLQSFLKQNEVKYKLLNRFIVSDEPTQTILGLKTRQKQANSVYLLVPDSLNLRKDFRQKTDFYLINGKRYTYVEADAKLDEVFIFPPVHKKLKPDEMVLNVYINRNKDSGYLQSKLYQQLAKPQYSNYAKSLQYSGEVEHAAICFQMNDYAQLSLAAYQPNTALAKEQIKRILSNSYEWNLQINSEADISTPRILKWLEQSQGPNRLSTQFYKSQSLEPAYAQQITGEQYQSIRDTPSDKVIYHYSQHCHGCKKFGGKYEQFARNRLTGNPNINFYRINNDKNKGKGVRNYNTTPVFVFYKKNYANPFLYRMPIFTQSLFDSFLKITSEIKLIKPEVFQESIRAQKQAESLTAQILSKVSVQ